MRSIESLFDEFLAKFLGVNGVNAIGRGRVRTNNRYEDAFVVSISGERIQEIPEIYGGYRVVQLVIEFEPMTTAPSSPTEYGSQN